MINSNTVSYKGIHCTVIIQRPSEKIVVVKISGSDARELGDAPLQELAKDIQKNNIIELFIDARDVRGEAIEGGFWANWLSANKSHFSTLTVLTGSRFIQLTEDFVGRFAGLGEIMRIYTDPAAFDSALEESLHHHKKT